MKPLFHPALVNGLFGDPGLYVDCLFEKRALLYDLGDVRALAPRKLLRVSDVFVSHTHMDHFFGFALEEKQHVNVWKSRLAALGWPTGPWLRELKHAVLAIEPDTTPFRVWWKAHGVMHEELLPLGELKQRILDIFHRATTSARRNCGMKSQQPLPGLLR